MPELCRDIEQGSTSTLIILGGNPAYDAPGDLKFAEALGQVGTTIRLGAYEDETSRCQRDGSSSYAPSRIVWPTCPSTRRT